MQEYTLDTTIRSLEEQQRLLKERLLLIGQALVKEREKTFTEFQELKKDFILIKEETARMQEFLQRVAEQLSSTTRKEELIMVQHQLDLLRKTP